MVRAARSARFQHGGSRRTTERHGDMSDALRAMRARQSARSTNNQYFSAALSGPPSSSALKQSRTRSTGVPVGVQFAQRRTLHPRQTPRDAVPHLSSQIVARSWFT
jgi:hypothetical protein